MSHPELPAPMMSTRLPASWLALLYALVCSSSPVNSPRNDGTFGSASVPFARITPAYRDSIVPSGPSARSIHAPSSARSSEVTFVSKRNASVRPNRSAKSRKYRSSVRCPG